jgi:dolichol-phosphate mannosyltransferase
MARLIVCLPCYNEEAALPELLERLAAVRHTLLPTWDLMVLVVDDGSSDDTAKVALSGRSVEVELLRHPGNLGLGRTLLDGCRWAADHCGAGDVFALMDADLTHPPELLPALLAKMAETNADVVIASRYAPGGAEIGLPGLRRIYSRLACAVLRLLAPSPGLRDYTCGYRIYRVETLKLGSERYGERLIEERGFVCMAELLIKLRAVGACFAELGLVLRYDLKTGASKMNVPDTIRRYGSLCLRLLLDGRLRSKPLR